MIVIIILIIFRPYFTVAVDNNNGESLDEKRKLRFLYSVADR